MSADEGAPGGDEQTDTSILVVGRDLEDIVGRETVP